MSVQSYGVAERNRKVDRLTVHIEELDHRGFTVIDSGFSAAEIEALRSALDALLEAQIERGGGRERMQAIGEAFQVRAPLAFDDRFLAIAAHPDIVEIARRLMGGYVTLMQQNGIRNAPADRHGQSAFHRDLPYQHFTSSRPIAINALLCLDEFTPETGSTVVLPGSHKVEAFPTDEYVERNETPTTAPAGAYLILNSMLYHRAGHNVSNRVRRAVNNVYTIPFIKQQIVLPAQLGGKWSDDPALARLLGYESDPPRSVDEYIAARAARAGESKM